MPGKDQFFIGRNEFGCYATVGRADAPGAGRVRLIGFVIKFNAEPGRVLANPALDHGAVLANADGENQRTKAAERCGLAAELP